jgi:hypothetical protein
MMTANNARPKAPSKREETMTNLATPTPTRKRTK